MSEITITGLRELVTALKELPKEIQGKVLGQAVSKSARVIRDVARQKASTDPLKKDTGLMEKALVSYRNKASTPDRIIYNVGETMSIKHVGEVITKNRKQLRTARAALREANKSTGSQSAFYWRFHEFGTKHEAAKPFMRPAFEETKKAAAEGIKDFLADAIEKAAAKLGRK